MVTITTSTVPSYETPASHSLAWTDATLLRLDGLSHYKESKDPHASTLNTVRFASDRACPCTGEELPLPLPVVSSLADSTSLEKGWADRSRSVVLGTWLGVRGRVGGGVWVGIRVRVRVRLGSGSGSRSVALGTGVMSGLEGADASGVDVGDGVGEPVVSLRKREPMPPRLRGEAAHDGAPIHATALVTSSRRPRLLVALGGVGVRVRVRVRVGLGLGFGLGLRVGVRRGSCSP